MRKSPFRNGPRPRARARRARGWVTPRIEWLEERRLLSNAKDTNGMILPPDLARNPAVQPYRLSNDLIQLYNRQVMGVMGVAAAQPVASLSAVDAPLTYDAAGRVAVDVTAVDVAALK